MLRPSFAFNTGMPRFAAFALVVMTILLPRLGFAQSRASGGDNFTLLVTDSGNVWSFGKNSVGQLGVGDMTDRRSPAQVPGVSGVIAVAAGASHSLALTTTGELYSWGRNVDGQIGDASNTDRSSPQLLTLSNVVAIAAGRNHSLALTGAGDLYAWGANDLGQLGTGDTTDRNTPVLVLSDVSALGAGENHSLAVKPDGSVWGFGKNSGGQLGNNAATSGATSSPVQMMGIANAVAASGGSVHSIILLADGTVKATGWNVDRQLGDGTSATQRLTPVAVAGLTNIERVAVGWFHNVALDDAGRLWTWGDGSKGAVGTGNQTDVNPPALLASPTTVLHVGAGWAHSIAIDANGVVSTWGSNDAGELGDGTLVARWAPEAISSSGYSWRVGTPTFSIAAGTYNIAQNVTVAVDTAGASIHYTVDGSDPTTADPSVTSGGSLSIDVSRTLRAKAFKAGMPDSAVKTAAYTLQGLMPDISPSGGTFSSSQTVSMQTGTSGAAIRYTLDGTDPTSGSTAYTAPFAVNATTTIKSAAFKSGWSASSVRTATLTFNYGALDMPSIEPASGSYAGTVSVTMSSTQEGAVIRYTTNGATPIATSTPYTGPVPISQTSTVKAKVFHSSYTTSAETSRTYTMSAATPTFSVAAGSYAPGSVVTISTSEPTATLRMTIDGNDPTSTSPIVASGTSLILGNFTLKVKSFRAGAADSGIASAAYSLTSALGPGAITTGGAHNVLATPDGRLLVWGNNSNGQLGNEATTDRPTPTLINTITGVTALAGGLAHTLALTADGQVYAFGSNGSGRLGNGNTDQSTRPVHVSTLSNVVAIAAGDTHSLALRSDGLVFSWGANTTGQLGLGTSGAGTEQIVPTQISTLSNIVAIAAGDAQSFAVTSSGQVYAWGANGNARLGDGSTDQRTAPVLLGLSNIVSIAAGQAHTLALTSGGRVYGWGANTNGQLGITPATTVATPTLIPNLHASAIAAGDNQSGAIRADGALLMWGSSSAGQVGSGSITATISTPTPITSVTGASTLSLGDLHSVAMTAAGETWAWGESADYRLGNNATSPDKSSPQSIFTGLTSWAPAAPTVDVASGSLGAITTVTLTSSTSGAVIRYTQNGSLPTESDTQVPANGQIEIGYSSLLRARAFVTGRQPGIAPARADYELQSAAPVISPGTGTYTAAQTVSITATGAPGEIRYTLDGSEPTSSSLLYSGPVGVSTGTTIKAKTFPSNGWAASPVASASLTFNYGILDPPIASPGAGVFATTPQVTLTAMAGASIRYTLNGTIPTASSTLYTAPVSVPSGGATLKSIAFHPDWTANSVRSDVYTIDTTPPTITPLISPNPNAAGWNHTAVIVRFVCSDASEPVSCPEPVTLTQNGAAQVVTRTAYDSVGNSQSASVTLNIDRSQPDITITTQVPAQTSESTFVVSGEVSDSLSGLAHLACNGVATAINDGQYECAVALRPGRNSILTVVTDVAGNSKSSNVRINRFDAGVALVMAVTPPTAHHVVGEERELVARDQFGRTFDDVEWVSSDPSIATVSVTDGVFTALAVGVGSATFTATSGTITSSMTFVVHQGISLPTGVERWTLPQRPQSFSVNTIIGSQPAEAALFSIEYDTTDYRGATVRALGVDGSERWIGTLPISSDEAVSKVVSHPLGGLVALTTNTTTANRLAVIYDTVSPDLSPWRYESSAAWGLLAVANNGTVYVVEHFEGGTAPDYSQLTVLDGLTGTPRSSTVLPPYIHYTHFPIDFLDENSRVDVVTTSNNHAVALINSKEVRCFVGEPTCSGYVAVELYDFSPDGSVSKRVLDTTQGTVGYHIAADGMDGVMVTRGRQVGSGQMQFYGDYIAPDFTNTYSLPNAWVPTITTHDGIGISGRMQYWAPAPMVARNLRTGTALWSHEIEADTLVAITGGGARVAYQNGDMRDIESDGTLGNLMSFGVASGQYAYGRFHVRRDDGALAAVPSGPMNDATAFITERAVQAQGPPAPDYGVFAKTFLIVQAGIPVPSKHVGIRVAPRNQVYWREHVVWGSLFEQYPKVWGDVWYITLGATQSEPDGYLAAAVNRRGGIGGDFTLPPVDNERLLISPSNEDAKIGELISRLFYFPLGTVDYNAFPETPFTDGYNSNSFARGLLEACGIPLPLFPASETFYSFYGWSVPVPTSYFQP